MMNEESNMVVNNGTTTESGSVENEARNSDSTNETTDVKNENGNTKTSNNNSEEAGGAPLTNDEIRELMKHGGGGFNNGMNPEALERLLNQPGPDTKALLERISGVLEIQDGNIGKSFAKINDLELKVASLTATNRFITIIAIASFIIAIASFIK